MFTLRKSLVSTTRYARSFHSTKFAKKVEEITSTSDYKSKVLTQNIALVDFYATWCGPCKAISPVVEKMSEFYPQVGFYKLDVDELQEVASENQITAMPTFKIFKNGKNVSTIVGANPQGINQAIIEAVGN